MIREVTVALGDHSYPILIGDGALSAARDALSEIIGKGQAAIVTDKQVWDAHGATALEALGPLPIIEVPSGERTKSFAQFEAVTEALLAAKVGRDGVIIAFGGGVVGDLAGFCAATLRRGCTFVQIPTTLLAQVDSSVGGKTAINSAAGKNLVGAFHQPSLVISDTNFLSTLPTREWKSGYAEIVKYGLLGDASFFTWLEEHGAAVLAQDHDTLAQAIETSCQAKAAIVREDEREGGERALLNLGHTFGHALEAAMGYDGRLLHGEAVSIGMAMAFRFAAKQGLCPPNAPERVERHLRALGLWTRPTDIAGLNTTPAEQLGHMAQDKKNVGGTLTFILPHAIGDAHIHRDVSPTDIETFLTQELASHD